MENNETKTAVKQIVDKMLKVAADSAALDGMFFMGHATGLYLAAKDFAETYGVCSEYDWPEFSVFRSRIKNAAEGE